MTKSEEPQVPGNNPAAGDETPGLQEDSPPDGLSGTPFIEHWSRRPAREDGKQGTLVTRTGLWEEFRESSGGRNFKERLESSRPWDDLERKAKRPKSGIPKKKKKSKRKK